MNFSTKIFLPFQPGLSSLTQENRLTFKFLSRQKAEGPQKNSTLSCFYVYFLSDTFSPLFNHSHFPYPGLLHCPSKSWGEGMGAAD